MAGQQSIALSTQFAGRAGAGTLASAVRFVRRKPLGAAGAAIILTMIIVALLAPLIAPYDPYEQNLPLKFQAPGAQHLLGTDELGRDLLSRIMWGARISLWVGILAVGIGHTSGLILGLVGAYYGGKVDMVIQRGIEVVLSFPGLVLALAVVAALGASITNVMVAIAIVIIPGSTRVIRSTALSVKQRQYIDAAKAIGCRDLHLITRHMLPNCLAPYIIVATAGLGGAILTEASLSFLGAGTPPPEPSWGLMLSGSARLYLELAPHMALYPGLAITLAVFGFNLFGDALRDTWDPRLRGR